MAKGALFHIVCPCKCGRVFAAEFQPIRINEKYIPRVQQLGDREIRNLGNVIWQRVVDARGLEGAIEFLHERSEA